MKNSQKLPDFIGCEICDYSCSHGGDLKKHILTLKHRRKLLETDGTPKIPLLLYDCSICNKTYKSKSGLWKHKKRCKTDNKKGRRKGKSGNESEDAEKEGMAKKLCELKPQDLVSLLVKQQEELNTKNKELVELYKKSNTINNSISINIFLNEHCKDAMNLKDFVENLQLSLEDLTYTGKHGYSKGIANILIKNLGDIDPTSRPIHCTDKKRLQFYVKDENKWEKDEGNKKIDHSIEKVTSKQYSCIKDWQETNKICKDGEKMQEFFKITNSCSRKEEDNNKVMKRVADAIQIKDAISKIKGND